MNTLWGPTLKIWFFGLVKIPLILFTRPRILQLNDQITRVMIPFKRRNRNHVGSMYFGALAIGADLCIGLTAMHHIERSGKRIVLVFKDLKADFKKLALGDVHFICDDAENVRALVAKAASSSERQNATIKGYGICPTVNPDERVYEFELTLSLKSKS